MPNLSNISSYGGSNLNIKNLDVVDLAADNISCDTLVVGGETVSISAVELTEALYKTQNISSDILQTNATQTYHTQLFKTNTLECSGTATLLGNAAIDGNVNTDFISSYSGNGNLILGAASTQTDLVVDCNTSTRTGLVGIGTATPTSTLEVNGGIKGTGIDTNLTYQTLNVGATATKVLLSAATKTVETPATLIVTNALTTSTIPVKIQAANLVAGNSVTLAIGKSDTTSGSAAITYFESASVTAKTLRFGLQGATTGSGQHVWCEMKTSQTMWYNPVNFQNIVYVDGYELHPFAGGVVALTGQTTALIPLNARRQLNFVLKEIYTGSGSSQPYLVPTVSSGTYSCDGLTAYPDHSTKTNWSGTNYVSLDLTTWSATNVLYGNFNLVQVNSTTYMLSGLTQQEVAATAYRAFTFNGIITTSISNALTGLTISAGGGYFLADLGYSCNVYYSTQT